MVLADDLFVLQQLLCCADVPLSATSLLGKHFVVWLLCLLSCHGPHTMVQDMLLLAA
jgi:hypothetical protein